MLRKITPLTGAVLTAALLALCFPSGGGWPLAWVALIPLLLVVDGISFKASFGLGYSAGLVFFISTLFWIHHVTPAGLILLSAYLALYWGVFAWAARWSVIFSPAPNVILSPAGAKDLQVVRRVIFLASLWTALEYARATLFTGFGWSALAHTQSANVMLIQCADITGTYGVSFLVAAVNVAAALVLKEWHRERRLSPGTRQALCVVAVLVMAAVLYGGWKLSRPLEGARTRVSLVQGNVSLAESWDERLKTASVERLMAMSRRVAAGNPELIIWSETAFPAFTWDHPELWAGVHDLARQTRSGLLLGSVTRRGEEYYNSALLIDARGEDAGTYSKQHLVLFGEYIPFRKQLPWLSQVVPIDDFTPGKVPSIFRTLSGQAYAPLICFEDTLPELARTAVGDGAGFLVNITNDAWFGDTRQPWMHLDNAVFRSVENRVTLVRATNTGVSCVIWPTGKVEACAADTFGRHVMAQATLTADIPAARQGSLTFYTKYGDVFAILCFLGILGTVVLRKPNPSS